VAAAALLLLLLPPPPPPPPLLPAVTAAGLCVLALASIRFTRPHTGLGPLHSESWPTTVFWSSVVSLIGRVVSDPLGV
jgi:hypothetical protein